ncbi:MAG: hypothetical protein US42_C0003G0011 [Candidatus Magasanikbacteria bacterium GW2011_GWC2_37_14]|uniref:Acyltransferase 3 domain-containing protein n=1 Tax=Candidatus Magasanikbacteria bacterium GW2011_GWC2_37_14 TaxID=1619046 RepID=A0A0G0IUW2_9BACT|nr:MAG: hypothetical protein US42_C0003G0011 [Candidatus Magasanikbacteria bacterium GW2011_GWC2_37_14]
MAVDSTTELKGLAILAIILAHIGYGLVTNNKFLYPLSTWAGVGVDLFFFLSAYGLTLSALRVKSTGTDHAARKKDLTIPQFYWRRLSKVLIPLWIFLIIFFLADKFILGINYSGTTIIQAFLGFFPRAHLYLDVNSPLWFITPLIFYYLIFPIIFIKKIPELTAIFLGIIGAYLIKMNLDIDAGVRGLWTLHYLAFPLGILFASLFNRIKNFQPLINLKNKLDNKKLLSIILRSSALGLMSLVWLYLFTNSGVGREKIVEQLFSLLALLITTFIFILKPIESKFLIWLGIFSFEAYLLHWPLMYRYDIFFKYLPAGVVVMVYLILFILLGFIINYLKKTFFIKKN